VSSLKDTDSLDEGLAAVTRAWGEETALQGLRDLASNDQYPEVQEWAKRQLEEIEVGGFGC